MWGNGMMYGYQGGMGWMVLGLVFWVAVIAGIVLLVLWIVGKSGKGKGEQAEDTALGILNKRYARGEITKEQYEEMKRDISNS
ncbi:MAG: SHOCT domain-containing protein [Geobacteraceae bacterium]|nr:SHOCT domain-containing protein [Geobacteraceae bacterium]